VLVVAYDVALGDSTFCAVAPLCVGALCTVLFAMLVVVFVASPTVLVMPVGADDPLVAVVPAEFGSIIVDGESEGNMFPISNVSVSRSGRTRISCASTSTAAGAGGAARAA